MARERDELEGAASKRLIISSDKTRTYRGNADLLPQFRLRNIGASALLTLSCLMPLLTSTTTTTIETLSLSVTPSMTFLWHSHNLCLPRFGRARALGSEEQYRPASFFLSLLIVFVDESRRRR